MRNSRIGSSARTGKMWNLDKTPSSVRRHVALIGAHNRAVLGVLLGMNDSELADLAERQVVY